MKRFVRLIGVLLTLAMVCGTLSGCKSSDYEKAQKLDSEESLKKRETSILALVITKTVLGWLNFAH